MYDNKGDEISEDSSSRRLTLLLAEEMYRSLANVSLYSITNIFTLPTTWKL